MNREKQQRRMEPGGFSLVELLVVIGMLGLVMAAVNTLYISHQRSATTETEVLDVQQNLRIAMDQMTRDLEMAGFMISAGNLVTGFVNGVSPVTDAMTLSVGAESAVAATIDTTIPAIAIGAGSALDLPVVAVGGSIGGFESSDVGTAKVRVVNYRTEPLGAGTVFTVNQVNTTAGTCGVVVAPCLRLSADTAAAGAISRGDTVLKTSTGGAEAFPHTVMYSVGACPAGVPGQCLIRTVTPPAGGAATPVATNITDLQFRYLLNGNIEVDAPTAGELSLIRAVRVTITGQIIATTAVSGGSLKTRTLSSVIALKNK